MARVRITWDKIRVHKAETFASGLHQLGVEPGKSAEWQVFFEVRVNGQKRADVYWENFEVRNKSTHPIDRQMDVELDGPLSIEVWGREDDETNDNDDLPVISVAHAPEAGWNKTGGVEYQKSNRDSDFDYTVHYRIENLDKFGGVLTPGHGTLFETRFSGLWDAGTHHTVSSTGLTAAEVNKQASELWGRGGRFAQLQPYVVGNRLLYNVIWTFTGIRQLWSLDCDDPTFVKLTGDNWSWSRPYSAVPYVLNGQVRYAALWNEGQHGQRWHHNTDDAGFRAITGETWSWARPHQVYGFVVNGSLRYSCLWNADQKSVLWHPNCSEEEAYKLGGDSWSWGRAHQIQPFILNGQRRYSLLWRTGQHGQLWNVNCDRGQVDANTNDTSSWARPRQLLAPPN